MPEFTLSQIALLAIVFVAAVIDMKTTKIYNVITFPAAFLGIVVNFMTHGWQGALMAVAGWFLAALLMVVPDRKKKMAFGDAKLMAAVGAFLGPGGMLIAFLYFSLFYGLIAAFKFCTTFPWREFFKVFKVLGVENVAMSQDSIDTEEVSKALKSKIALGPAIAFGTLFAIVFQKQTLLFMGFNNTELFGMPMVLSAILFQ